MIFFKLIDLGNLEIDGSFEGEVLKRFSFITPPI